MCRFKMLLCCICMTMVANSANAADPTPERSDEHISCSVWTFVTFEPSSLSTDTCTRTSYSLSVSDRFQIESYQGHVDPEQSFRLADDSILINGVTISSKLGNIPGKPNIVFDVGQVRNVAFWNPRTDPLWTESFKINMNAFKIGGQADGVISFGPYRTQSYDPNTSRLVNNGRAYGVQFKLTGNLF